MKRTIHETVDHLVLNSIIKSIWDDSVRRISASIEGTLKESIWMTISRPVALSIKNSFANSIWRHCIEKID